MTTTTRLSRVRRYAATAVAVGGLVVVPMLPTGAGAQPAPTGKPAFVYGWDSVDSGGNHSCGVRTNHTLWCWGNNSSGQIGDGTSTNRHHATQVGFGSNWASVSAGYAHTCAIRLDGALFCWGSNSYGQLGVGDTSTRYTPTRVGTADWLSLSAGGYHTCGVRSDRSLG
jgi:alpha-tubulin suppressor-like RCC1 family protein